MDEAVANYSRIGVINTTPYSVPYIREGLVTRAEKQGKKLELLFSEKETERALDLFNAGDFDAHDDRVLQQMRCMERAGVDCILMGQIPFAMMEKKTRRSPGLYRCSVPARLRSGMGRHFYNEKGIT